MFSWYANVQQDLKYYFKALDREQCVRKGQQRIAQFACSMFKTIVWRFGV